MGMNFSAILMEIAFLICGAVMGKKIVKMVVMKKAAMGRYGCVITKPNFPVEVQVSSTLVQLLTWAFLELESFWLIPSVYLICVRRVLVFLVSLLTFYMR